MNLTAAHTTVDPYETWLATNSAAWCRRLSATITTAACAANRALTERKFGDCRCAGCGGLDDQSEPKALISVVNVLPTTEENPLTLAFSAMLQEILNTDDGGPLEETYDDEEMYDPEPQCALFESTGTTEYDPFTSLLLAKLHSYEDEEPEHPETKQVEIELPERKRWVRVFMGRCHRCNGYMVHGAKEHHDGATDDEVYRCFNCGWKISPQYDYNRKNPGEGWR